MKPTIRGLAKHINQTEANLYHKKRKYPILWDIIWRGWLDYLKGVSK